MSTSSSSSSSYDPSQSSDLTRDTLVPWGL